MYNLQQNLKSNWQGRRLWWRDWSLWNSKSSHNFPLSINFVRPGSFDFATGSAHTCMVELLVTVYCPASSCDGSTVLTEQVAFQDKLDALVGFLKSRHPSLSAAAFPENARLLVAGCSRLPLQTMDQTIAWSSVKGSSTVDSQMALRLCHVDGFGGSKLRSGMIK